MKNWLWFSTTDAFQDKNNPVKTARTASQKLVSDLKHVIYYLLLILDQIRIFCAI